MPLQYTSSSLSARQFSFFIYFQKFHKKTTFLFSTRVCNYNFFSKSDFSKYFELPSTRTIFRRLKRVQDPEQRSLNKIVLVIFPLPHSIKNFDLLEGFYQPTRGPLIKCTKLFFYSSPPRSTKNCL